MTRGGFNSSILTNGNIAEDQDLDQTASPQYIQKMNKSIIDTTSIERVEGLPSKV